MAIIFQIIENRYHKNLKLKKRILHILMINQIKIIDQHYTGVS